jgi:pimeloyl-ACP methyl ester carboxylesterase
MSLGSELCILARMEIDEVRKIEGLAVRLYRPGKGMVVGPSVILFLHGGPGYAAANLDAKLFGALLDLTQASGCVVFDQRGCGNSLSCREIFRRWKLESYVQDVRAVVEWIQARFEHAAVLLVAHSWGTIVAVEFLRRFSSLVCGYLAISQVVHGIEGECYSYRRALGFARGRGARAWAAILQMLGGPPHNRAMNLLYLACQRHVVRSELHYLKIETLSFMPSLVGEGFATRLKYGIGYGLSVYKLWPQCLAIEFERTSLSFDVPCVFLSGGGDPITPAYLVARYVSSIECRSKALFLANSSGHRPHLTDPGELSNAVRTLRRFVGERTN